MINQALVLSETTMRRVVDHLHRAFARLQTLAAENDPHELLPWFRDQAERSRTLIRMLHRRSNDRLKSWQTSGKISQDDHRTGIARVQKFYDQYIGEIDSLLSEKEKEIERTVN